MHSHMCTAYAAIISITSFVGDITAVDGASPIDVLLAVDSKLNADTDIMPLAAQTVCKVP